MLCEMDTKGALADAIGAPPFAFAATQPLADEPNLWGLAVNTEDALYEYVRLYVKIPLLTKLGVLSKTLDFVADAAPGVREVLMVGKVCYEVREQHFDLVIVDAESSGHVVSQIASPRVITSLVQFGMLRDQTQWMIDILSAPSTTGVVVVTTPEESPVDESIDLVTKLRSEARVDVAALVVNRMPDVFGTDADRARMETLTATDERWMMPSTLAQAAVTRRTMAVGQVSRLQDSIESPPPVVVAPLLPVDSESSIARQMANHLAEELGAS